jgi:polyisoprenoid-binding protein YceI
MKKQMIAVLATATALAMSCTKDENKTDIYNISSKSSVAKWRGYLRTGYFNEGTIDIENTNIKVKDGIVTEGSFVLPLKSLKNLNLPDEQKPMLISHLQSADFFNMVVHPDLKFVIEKVEPYYDSDTGVISGANYRVTGNLTMLGATHPINFPARINIADQQLDVAATIKVDRTQWGITYASEDTLPDDKYILPVLTLDIDVKGSKQ